MLEVNGLCVSYGDKEALMDVSVDVGAKEVLGVIGPNGAGKTTLLRCVDGIIKPRSGRIHVDGRELQGIKSRDIAKLIGYVPQISGEIPEATVFDAVLMGRKPYMSWRPGNKDFEIALNVMRVLGIEALSMRNLHELSGGERQKIMIARALAQEPRLLLLDEPTSNLDLKHQLEVMELLRNRVDKGLSAIVAMHDLNMAARYCDRLVILNRGSVYATGGREILTQESIRQVYGVDVRINEGPDGIWIIPQRSVY